ncbi:MAG: undecaprenyl-diphosphate phosphatase [Thermodesulfobacteria bacterium]|nr:undecaprenyl-diphosphate phosphatase [Thermodesulfobacteriota bacterium]
MEMLKIIFLGMVQGLTEFLPISSTGHLILAEKFFHITSSLSFDAFMHLGSFLAILIYFWNELKEIWGYKWLVFVAILPGGIAGLLLEHIVDTYLRTPQMVAFFLLIMSIPMILGEKFGKKTKDIKELSIKEAGFIGVAQALALLPGTSRSGITISAGLLTGLKRDIAAKFSFIAGAPLILGAGLYEGIKLVKHHTIPYDLAFVGFLSAAIWSFIAIAILIPFLKKHSLYSFVVYRILLASLIFLLLYK